MNAALTQFHGNIESARHLGVIFAAFEDKVTEAVNLDELLRAEIVLAVSALDCYVHDVVRLGMLRGLPAATGEPDAYLSFGVSLGFVKRLMRASSAADCAALLDAEVRRVHGFQTFQNADKISQALALIGIQSIWPKVAAPIGISASDVRTRLNLIVDRRNKIAHEGDIDPSLGIGNKYPIDLPTVVQTADFLESVVQHMHATIVSEIPF